LTREKLVKAQRYAKKQHRCQLRKDEKTPYWFHLRQVVRNLSDIGIKDNDILCAGWLHDTIEDTDTDFDDLEKKFGKRVARIVVQVTKDKTLPQREKEREFCEKLSGASWEAQAVKLCDLWANLADLETGYKNKRKRKNQIRKTLRYLDAIKPGLTRNSKRFPRLKKGIDEINKILTGYRIPVVVFR
jgi:guanosine-3',5'-bis(diphosphate) 3'-pyrophosphohydrolase